MKRENHTVNQKDYVLVDKERSANKPGLWARLLDYLFPSVCLLCSAPGEDTDICRDCVNDLPVNHRPCQQCGLPLPDPDTEHCGICLRHTPAYDRTLAPWLYQFPIDRLIQQYKFHRNLSAGRTLSLLMAAAADPTDLPKALIPIPLHPRRQAKRGFNQSLLIASDLGQQLNLPVLNGALIKTLHTPAQASLSLQHRRRSPQGAFQLHELEQLPPHVAIVDDVMTTGATMDECARRLKVAGVKRVDAWVLARTL